MNMLSKSKENTVCTHDDKTRRHHHPATALSFSFSTHKLYACES